MNEVKDIWHEGRIIPSWVDHSQVRYIPVQYRSRYILIYKVNKVKEIRPEKGSVLGEVRLTILR